MHILAVATSQEYASSPSGYVISILIFLLIAIIGYDVKRNDSQAKDVNKKLERVGMDYNALNTTVAVLGNTVQTLGTTVDTLNKTVLELSRRN